MVAFFAHILFRALSGTANALYYADRQKEVVAACAAFSVSCFASAIFGLPLAGVAVFCLAGAAVVGKFRAFDGLKTMGSGDIHLWENIVMAGIPLAIVLSGGSIVLTALGLYPGLFLHKMLINMGGGFPVFGDQTDDETGKTYGMALPSWVPIFGGQKVNVPRTTQKTRLWMAFGCTVAAVAFRFSPFYAVTVWNVVVTLTL